MTASGVSSLAIVVAIGVGAVGHAQESPQERRARIIEQACHASELTSGVEFDRVAHVRQRFEPIVARDAKHKVSVVVVASDEINARNVPFNMRESVACIPSVMAHFMGSEGELAFLVGHEIGHGFDDACKTDEGRAQMATRMSPLATILGALVGENGPISEQQACESRADAIGFHLLTAARYSAYDAAGAFGRLEMYLGDTATGVVARLGAMGSDHPMTPDRIRHMRTLLARAASK